MARHQGPQYAPDSFALPARSQSTPQTLAKIVPVHYTSTYISTGSPTPSISGMTHFRSKAFARTILKIFCTFMDAEVEQKISEACIAFAKRFAWSMRVSRQRYAHPKITNLLGNLLLLVSWKRRKSIELRTD